MAVIKLFYFVVIFVLLCPSWINGRSNHNHRRKRAFPASRKLERWTQDIPETKNSVPQSFKNLDFGKWIRRENNRESATRSTGPDSLSSSSSNDVCMTSGCVKTAGYLLETIDLDVDPCEDFYQFACGKFIDSAVIMPWAGSASTFSRIGLDVAHKVNVALEGVIMRAVTSPNDDVDTLVGNFFVSCMDTQFIDGIGLEPLIEALISLNISIPMLDRYADEDRVKPVNVLWAQMINLMADTGLFGLDFSPDITGDERQYVLEVYQPRLGLPPALYQNEEAVLVYKMYLFKIASGIRDHIYATRQYFTSDEDLQTSIGNIIALEIELSKIMLNERIPVEESYKKYTFKEFRDTLKTHQELTADLTARVLLNLTGVKVTNDTELFIPHLPYFERLGTVLKATPEDDLANYLVLRSLVEFAGATPLRQFVEAFQSSLTGRRESSPRWMKCVQTTTHYFGAFASDLLINIDDGEEVKNETLKMISDIKNAFKHIIENSEWMDGDTMNEALDKLASIKAFAVTPTSLNKTVIENIYKDAIGSTKLQFYLHNLLAMQKFWTKKIMNELSKEKPPQMIDVNHMDFDTTLVNAMYSPDMNAIWIPLGIAHPPMYQDHRLRALNYGALGSIIAHELTHGFDNSGALFDKFGFYQEWWSEDTKEAFQDKQQCFIDHYSTYNFTELSGIPGYSGPVSVDGNLTLSENIADNGGLAEAFLAFTNSSSSEGPMKDLPTLPGLSQFSAEQLFFLSFGSMWCETKTFEALAMQLTGDVHPPHSVRISGAVKNSPEFAKAFKCKKADQMFLPEQKRCKIW